MAYLKNWTDNFFQICFMGTSWVAVSINNITTRASREVTSRKNIKIFDFNGVNVAKHWHVTGEVFAISDCLVVYVGYCIAHVAMNSFTHQIHVIGLYIKYLPVSLFGVLNSIYSYLEVKTIKYWCQPK